MKQLLIISFLLFSALAKAQNPDSTKLIGIHPLVGKTISQGEKIHYKLFPEYKDSVFHSAQLFKLNDSTFQLCTKTINGTEIKSYLTTKELDELYYRIDESEKAREGKQEEYVMTKEEKKEERRERAREANRSFWTDFLVQATIITFEAIITVLLTN